MKVEGFKSQGRNVGGGEVTFRIEEDNLTVIVSGKPRKRKDGEEAPAPMENTTIKIPFSERNLKSIFRLAVEGRNSLIAKALKEKDNQEFDVKLKGGEGVYVGFRCYRWGYSMLAVNGNEEALLLMKPKEFYPVAGLMEKITITRPKNSAVVSRDLDILVCQADKGKLTFKTVENFEEVAVINQKHLLLSMAEDLTDRIRIEDMYPARFGPITLSRRGGRSFLKADRYYAVTRKELITLQLLTRTALS
ncbi:hypothetical protein Theam_1805 (plasmid) [Thermovibrio ammonificans HB-1]|uniref:Uncharacterized protein n=1 Tax=Thermovibrio ammonificans (strain DSM 15698 / JCM 12110 / HB-1) TaxID=648996 RepID=E8T6T8_THEA1|nr:hypothetical protein [Thermovibrio ammonificans]ADU97761.1 hypothetical protein Theam_1805 [Thermovibrio ammonificans HB-1]